VGRLFVPKRFKARREEGNKHLDEAEQGGSLLEIGRAVLALQPFSVHIGAELVTFEPGRAELSVTVQPHLRQQNGFVHGGIVSYLVDNALTFAGGSVLGPNVLTQEFKVSYLRPANGERLVARASVVSSSKRQAVCRCDVFAVNGEDEALCATSLGTIMAALPS
jgi:uncharacterized protein (TIGR00369 family)